MAPSVQSAIQPPDARPLVCKITRIGGYRAFRDFRWPNDVPSFARYNLIYGWNASGKTSLSGIFTALQLRSRLSEGSATLELGVGTVNTDQLGVAAIPSVRVFNRHFVDLNVFESQDGRLPPVYYLGEDSAEKQKRITELQDSTATAETSVPLLALEEARARRALETFCTERARNIKRLLALDTRFANFESPDYKKAVSALHAESPSPQPLSQTQRDELQKKALAASMEQVPIPTISGMDLTTLTTRVQALLDKQVVASALAELKDAPEVARWVQEGLRLHSASHPDKRCLFCSQTLPGERVKLLEAHFSDELRTLQGAIDTQLSELTAVMEAVRKVRLPPDVALQPFLRTRYASDLKAYESQAMLLEAYLSSLRRALLAKRENPFAQRGIFAFGWEPESQPTTFQVVLAAVATGVGAWAAMLGMTVLANLARTLKEHNNFCIDFSNEVSRARDGLARDEVLHSLAEWRALSSDLERETRGLTDARELVAANTAELLALRESVREHHGAAAELTRELAAFLGRDELVFEVRDNGYVITRAGVHAQHLSDGERTSIAFMYFLKSLSDTAFDLSRGVVVIDDPVSSMDADSMHCAFAYMKKRTAGAGQLIVLTHSFVFFRLVKGWFNVENGGWRNAQYSPSNSEIARFYMLRRQPDGNVWTAGIENIDPLLHRYESEYHYLFSQVHALAASSQPRRLEEYLGAPNIARRLLESFVAFKAPDKIGKLERQMEELWPESTLETERILRFLHVHSHGDRIGEPELDLSLLSETPEILADLLQLMELSDRGHFAAMVASLGR